MPGIVEDIGGAAGLHQTPRVHDGHSVGHAGHHAQIVRDEDDAHAGLALHVAQQIQHAGLHGHVQRGGGLVGQQDARAQGQGDGQHAALPHAAGKVVRLQAHARLGIVDAHQLQQLEGPLSGLLRAHAAMAAQGLHDLVAHGQGGVEAGHGILEEHGGLRAAHGAHLPLAAGHDVAAFQKDAARDAGIVRQQAQDGTAKHGLAAARFAHDGQGLPGVQFQIDAAHGLYLSGGGGEGDVQVFQLQQGRHGRDGVEVGEGLPDSVRRGNGSRARVVSRRAIRPVRRVRFGTGGRRTADDGGTASGLRTTAPPSETSSRGV